MPDPKSIAAWCAVPAAVGGMLFYLGTQIDARAQEAAKDEVKAQMAPVQQQLGELVHQGRRREDREALVFCLDREYQDRPAAERQRLCNTQSEYRWRHWAWEDCTQAAKEPATCGPEPQPPEAP